jgi:cytidylate kinase-like protein
VAARVVCISRVDAAGGAAVGSLVAQRLGFRYVDEEIIEQAAEKAGADPEDVADVEQRKSRLLRFIEDLGHFAPDADVSGTRVADQSHRELIQDVIAEVADQGSAVIVAHAASHALAGEKGVLRVLLTASADARARDAAKRGLETEEAERAVRDADAARADYLKRFYSVDNELPSQYDLVVNTERIGPEQAADLIVLAAGLAPE